MSTLRAKRLERYLAEVLGWETKGCPVYKCPACADEAFSRRAYCSNCGGRMPQESEVDRRLFDDLEKAIAYALGEKKRLPRR